LSKLLGPAQSVAPKNSNSNVNGMKQKEVAVLRTRNPQLGLCGDGLFSSGDANPGHSEDRPRHSSRRQPRGGRHRGPNGARHPLGRGQYPGGYYGPYHT
jgi:hypothetical protein